ncbi:MAG TPA: transcription elongation factor GreA [Oligoflexia bacterium]|nr:transcription elongation factor GreA [Oligoflexia bacterium]HMR25299.1 transcription elongation factor GreA [Oligoflexia bacterium]
MDRVPMTEQGKRNLQEELNQLKNVERPKISADIEEARGHGDLKENAEYHAAKEKQGLVEARIRFLEDQVARAEVIDVSGLSTDKVVFGLTVTLYDANLDKEMKYRIVGDVESNLEKGDISINSPIARALIGKQEGDIALVQAPGGERELEIVSIDK